ncbi:MAG: nucleotidyltransferase domain-containing protein [bacterium]|nr:nucleotidyltransferase domain-containing protein [bacterium]
MGSVPTRGLETAGSGTLVSEAAVTEAAELASPVEWGVPGLEDARRLGEGFVVLGATEVLVFGSVARGEAVDGSDIDLVAVFDDLGDYRCRPDLERRLVKRAGELSDFEVDVWVTDRPEWARRTTAVSSSLEAAIADEAVSVAVRGQCNDTDVDWGKEIGMPPDNRAEALTRLEDVRNALNRVEARLETSGPERRAVSAGSVRRHREARYERMVDICFHSQKAIESAMKTVVCLVGGSPERIHSLDRLAARIPSPYRDVTKPAMDPANKTTPEEISLWHRAGPYSDERPDLTLAQIEATAAELARIACDTAETLVRHFEAADDARTLVADIADTVGTVRVVLDGSGINPTIELD